MKNLSNRTVQTINYLMAIVIMCFTLNVASAQITVVSFMKVKPDKWSEYLEVEKTWSKFHQKRVDNGYMQAWYLNEKMFGGANDEYDYITINVFRDWAAYEKELPEEIYAELGEDIMTKTRESRKLVRTEVYEMVVGAENSKPSKFTNLTFMKVEQGGGSEYEKMESKYYKVYHEELIAAGGLNNWSIYQRVIPYGFGGDFNYVATNGIESLSQGDNVSNETYKKAWEKALDGTSNDDLEKLTNESRKVVTSEMWKTVMSVTANK